ncbi:polyubiquitin [Penaeus vannamei]|uniref:polyubiquitin n=1 Tax=Penaeus vannamei TaxID=6689 RepID=UPI00387F8561
MAPKCKVCHGFFGPGDKTPLSLQCGHSTCKQCVLRLIDETGEIKCPTCRVVTDGANAEDLPVNYDLLDTATDDLEAPVRRQVRISVIVKDLTGKQFRVEVEPSSQVIQIKRSLFNQYGLTVDNIALMLHGQRLREDETIADNGIVEGDIIEMTTRYEGGKVGGI